MISVIIPAYNEEKRITKTVLAIEKAMQNQKDAYEILVVNDGSQDKTIDVVKGLENGHIRLLSYEKNRGKGGAVKFGVRHAAGQFIVFTDADLPYPPENIEKACNMLNEGYDLILGKRVQKENGGKYPWYRTIMSACFGMFVKSTLHLKEKDTQCGFKAFRYEAAQKIFERVSLSGWGFDVEMIFVAEKLGYKAGRLVVELFHNNADSKIHVVKDTITMIKEILKVRKNNQQGLYE